MYIKGLFNPQISSNSVMKQLCGKQEEDMEPMHLREETLMRSIKTIKQRQQQNCTTVERKKAFSAPIDKMSQLSASFQQFSELSTAREHVQEELY